MVIKQPGELRGECAAFGNQFGVQYVQIERRRELYSEMVPFGSKSMTLSMYIDAGEDLYIYTGLIALTDL